MDDDGAATITMPSPSEPAASSTTTTATRTPCRFFLKGVCRYGARCHFAHAAAASAAPAAAAVPPPIVAESTRITPSDPESWVLAPEFVPGGTSSGEKSRTFAEVVGKHKTAGIATSSRGPHPPPMPHPPNGAAAESTLCPYLMGSGICHYAACHYVHGDLCELCGKFCLHPSDREQRRRHNNECIAQHERDMEISFAIQKSKDKTCGVCFEVIMEKPGREQRFGILPNCIHCFCLDCIRKWRQAEQFDNKIKRSCPECRITSDFVCPSIFWVDTKEEKEKLIQDYKNAMEEKDCKYYNKGRGKCPFGNKCFYKHALPDGTKVDVGPVPRPPRRHNQYGELEELEEILFWDFIEERNHRLIDDVVSFFSDSDNNSYLADIYDLYDI